MINDDQVCSYVCKKWGTLPHLPNESRSSSRKLGSSFSRRLTMHHLLSRVGDEGLSRIFLVFFSSFLTSQVIFLSHKKSTPQTFQTSNIQFLNAKFSCFHQRKWNSNFKVMIKNIFYGSSSSFYLHQKRIVPSLESSLTN